MPLLRGHHLICLHFFNGEGYDEPFKNNLKKTLKRAETEEITISSGADDVCRCCPYIEVNRCRYTENSDDDISDMDTEALTLLNLSKRDKVKWDELRKTVHRIFPAWYSSRCIKCDWKAACEKNALFQELTKK